MKVLIKKGDLFGNVCKKREEFCQDTQMRQLAEDEWRNKLEKNTLLRFAREKGEAKGEARGEARGRIEGKIAGILQLLEMKFEGKIPATLRKNIRKITEIKQLDALFSIIFHAESVEEVGNYLGQYENAAWEEK